MPFDDAEHERLSNETFSARDRAWEACGEVDPYVLAPLINPALQGAPPWPNLRQAYKTIRGPLGVFLATDGLSDPFDDSWANPPRQNGFAMEVYAITRDITGELKDSWVFPIIAGFAEQVARHGHVHQLLDELGTISSELYDVPIPDAYRAKFVNDAQRVGVIVGLEAPQVPSRVDGPVSPIRLTSLVLLTTAELAHIVERGDAGRREVAERLMKTEAPLVSGLERASVV